ncbi:hypothetical protein EYC84_008481 [Monilinia fructicola]|uniref:Uncharacterized protein n=1 Tax=Monilinia fructicola TaxID=38448 RepID=A0A5M9JH37_MONFR|nr:hypothetical protein EYC84_008481 [Monilinia fructicola]
MPSTHFSAKYSSIVQGIVDPILLKLSNVPSPNFTELNLIIRGSKPSVVLMSFMVLCLMFAGSLGQTRYSPVAYATYGTTGFEDEGTSSASNSVGGERLISLGD